MCPVYVLIDKSMLILPNFDIGTVAKHSFGGDPPWLLTVI